jgi:hypothetical protein
LHCAKTYYLKVACRAEVKPEVTTEKKTFTMKEMETLVKEETDRVIQNVHTSCVEHIRYPSTG